MVPQERMRPGGWGAGGIDDLVPSSCASMGCSRSFRLFVPCPPPGDVPPAQRASDHDHRAPGHRGSPDGGPRGGPGGARSPALRATRASGTRGRLGDQGQPWAASAMWLPPATHRPQNIHQGASVLAEHWPPVFPQRPGSCPRAGGHTGASLASTEALAPPTFCWCQAISVVPWLAQSLRPRGM